MINHFILLYTNVSVEIRRRSIKKRHKNRFRNANLLGFVPAIRIRHAQILLAQT